MCVETFAAKKEIITEKERADQRQLGESGDLELVSMRRTGGSSLGPSKWGTHRARVLASAPVRSLRSSATAEGALGLGGTRLRTLPNSKGKNVFSINFPAPRAMVGKFQYAGYNGVHDS